MVQEKPILKGRTVAITRPSEQAGEAGKLINEMGGVPYYIPAIEIKGLSNPVNLKKFIWDLQKGYVDYVILMSTNGVRYLFGLAINNRLLKLLHEGLKKSFVIAVGPKTAEALKEHNVRVDMVPQQYSSEGLLKALEGKDLRGKKIRIPRTSNATPTLTDKLHEMGADVEEIHVYESGLTVDYELKANFYKDLTSGHIDAIVFGSGLSAKNIFKMLTEKASMEALRKIIREKITIVAIGPTTAEALKEINIQVDVIPTEYLFENALVALATFWANQ
jgi:uroporphyrinogen-III synthase